MTTPTKEQMDAALIVGAQFDWDLQRCSVMSRFHKDQACNYPAAALIWLENEALFVCPPCGLRYLTREDKPALLLARRAEGSDDQHRLVAIPYSLSQKVIYTPEKKEYLFYSYARNPRYCHISDVNYVDDRRLLYMVPLSEIVPA